MVINVKLIAPLLCNKCDSYCSPQHSCCRSCNGYACPPKDYLGTGALGCKGGYGGGPGGAGAGWNL